ncbi:MAG: hypothetical protein AAFR73_03130 [Pseudomonadota bacterium]
MSKRSAAFRYAYYLVTSFKFVSFRAWHKSGEPNPFVGKTYRRVATERVEFTDIFEDVLQGKKNRSRDAI